MNPQGPDYDKRKGGGGIGPIPLVKDFYPVGNGGPLTSGVRSAPYTDILKAMDDIKTSKPTNPKDQAATDKLPLHLVSPIVKAYQAIAGFLGLVKYGAWNYRSSGARISVYKSALDRHIDAWWEGEELDPTDGTPHLANALKCLEILIDSKHSGNIIDDRPPSRSDELAKIRSEFEALMPILREKYKDRNPRHYTIADD